MTDLLRRLACLLVGHRAVAYGPEVWLIVSAGEWVPARRAICTRCRWYGFQTTWGALIERGSVVVGDHG